MAKRKAPPPPTPTNVLTGTEGDDTLVAGTSGYTLNGLGGDDTLKGNLGADTIYGGDGNDLIVDNYVVGQLDNKNDLLYGGNGNDTITSTSGADLLDGGAGDDVLTAYGSGSILLGGDGNDRLSVLSLATSQVSDVTVDGGAGYDVASLSFERIVTALDIDLAAGQSVTFAETGTTVRGVEAFEIFAGSGDDRVALTANDDKAFGGPGNDTLAGRDGDDGLSGGSGNDLLDGGNGADRLAGGDDHDILTGGAGADEFQFGAEIDDAAHADLITDFNLAEGDVISFALAYEQDENLAFRPTDALGQGVIEVVDTAEGALIRADFYGRFVDVVVLEGITAAEVTNDYFIF